MNARKSIIGGLAGMVLAAAPLTADDRIGVGVGADYLFDGKANVRGEVTVPVADDLRAKVMAGLTFGNARAKVTGTKSFDPCKNPTPLNHDDVANDPTYTPEACDSAIGRETSVSTDVQKDNVALGIGGGVEYSLGDGGVVVGADLGARYHLPGASHSKKSFNNGRTDVSQSPDVKTPGAFSFDGGASLGYQVSEDLTASLRGAWNSRDGISVGLTFNYKLGETD